WTLPSTLRNTARTTAVCPGSTVLAAQPMTKGAAIHETPAAMAQMPARRATRSHGPQARAPMKVTRATSWRRGTHASLVARAVLAAGISDDGRLIGTAGSEGIRAARAGSTVATYCLAAVVTIAVSSTTGCGVPTPRALAW